MNIDDYKNWLITVKNVNQALDVFIILKMFNILLWHEDIQPREAVMHWKEYAGYRERHIYLNYYEGSGNYSPCFRSRKEYKDEETDNPHIISAEQFINNYYD